MKNIDLHVHSRYSLDADLTVSQLFETAREKNIEVLAIADHNLVAGTEEAMALAPTDIKIIPAVEFDCYYEGENVHIIGYNIDTRHPAIMDIVKYYYKLDLENSGKMVEGVNRLGLGISVEEVRPYAKSELIAGEDIADALLNHPVWSKHPLMEPYHKGGARSDAALLNFFFDFFAQGQPASAYFDYFDYRVIIEAIHASGGKAVLAHPGRYSFEMEDLPGRKHGMDGWEIDSFYHSSEIIEKYGRETRRQGLIATSGSDFHGSVKPNIEITAFQSDAADLLLK